MDNQSIKHYAALDLGSNSFHLVIVKYDGQTFHQIGKHKEKVQLASGLNQDDILSEEAIDRGLECLKLFSERLRDIPKEQIKVVATYTLRKAKNAQSFIHQAEEILSVPIEILPGKEEARLIYNGVSHNHPDIEKTLVIDIGGGSTEIVLGDKFEPLFLDSLSLGCVTYQRFFPDNIINEANFERALLNATLIISPVEHKYLAESLQYCLGSSGSIEAIYRVIQGFGFKDNCIQLHHLRFLKSKLIEIGSFDNINLEGLSKPRVNTFTTGLVILLALFQELKIQELYVSNASLREGILLELADELRGNDNRNQTVESLSKRFDVDSNYATNIETTALDIFASVADLWGIYDPHYVNLLKWACRLHEVGLSISYSKMRFHSAHIVQYADMPGFSQQTKESLACIIQAQNKKIYPDTFENRYEPKQALLAIAQILRLSILLNIKRTATDISPLQFNADQDNQLTIEIPQDWAQENQLLMLELEKEKAYLDFHNLKLDWKLT
ncbi:Ppx/GppA phosphatase family protein [Kangiella sp. TOML190]|uniref:Ppx/GppA phosphatase family protein n=1 Tax=Kangiella sp. TOML190 TaxID=2931351 RepID=UPI00203FC300|nr:Ppx/GppA phosphatase family protein [Kangiella sp. TOML190]